MLARVTLLDKFDYVILDCGYTSRLVAHYLELGATFALTHEKWTNYWIPGTPPGVSCETHRDPSQDRLLSSATVAGHDYYGHYQYDGETDDADDDAPICPFTFPTRCGVKACTLVLVSNWTRNCCCKRAKATAFDSADTAPQGRSIVRRTAPLASTATTWTMCIALCAIWWSCGTALLWHRMVQCGRAGTRSAGARPGPRSGRHTAARVAWVNRSIHERQTHLVSEP